MPDQELQGSVPGTPVVGITTNVPDNPYDSKSKRRKRKHKPVKRQVDYAELLQPPVEVAPSDRCTHTTRIQAKSACSSCLQAAGVNIKVKHITPAITIDDFWPEVESETDPDDVS